MPKQGGQLSYARVAGRASMWLLSANTIQRARSPRRILQLSRGQSAGLWMNSLKRGSPPVPLIPTGRTGGYHGLPRRIGQGLVGCHGTYPRGVGGFQAHVTGPGCSLHIEECGGLDSRPCGGCGSLPVSVPWAEPEPGHQRGQPCAQYLRSLREGVGGSEMEALHRREAGHILPCGC